MLSRQDNATTTATQVSRSHSEKMTIPQAATSHTRRTRHRFAATLCGAAAMLCLIALLHLSGGRLVQAASARVNMHQVSRQTNQCKYSHMCTLINLALFYIVCRRDTNQLAQPIRFPERIL